MNRHFNYPNISHWGDPTHPGRDFESGCVALSRDPMWVGHNDDLQQLIHTLSWSFLRRFARDRKRGILTELYT